VNGKLKANGNIDLYDQWLSGDGGNEGISVKSDGKVGIGTSNPTEGLFVNASIGMNILFLNINDFLPSYLYSLPEDINVVIIDPFYFNVGVYLPIPVNGKIVTIKQLATGNGTVQINATIDGNWYHTLAAYAAITLIAYDGQWFILSKYDP